MLDKKRWFWDSKFAEWLESRSFVFAYWVTDKRYPIDWDEKLKQEERSEWSTVTVAESDKSPLVEISYDLKIKKPTKKKKATTKKTPTKKTWNY